MIQLSIYLKEMKKPIVVVLNKQEQVNEFYELLQTHDIICFNPIIFKREDFLYAIEEA